MISKTGFFYHKNTLRLTWLLGLGKYYDAWFECRHVEVKWFTNIILYDLQSVEVSDRARVNFAFYSKSCNYITESSIKSTAQLAWWNPICDNWPLNQACFCSVHLCWKSPDMMIANGKDHNIFVNLVIHPSIQTVTVHWLMYEHSSLQGSTCPPYLTLTALMCYCKILDQKIQLLFFHH